LIYEGTGFVVNESMDGIFFGKAIHHIIFVFPDSFFEIACYARVQRSVLSTGENIHARDSFLDCFVVVPSRDSFLQRRGEEIND